MTKAKTQRKLLAFDAARYLTDDAAVADGIVDGLAHANFETLHVDSGSGCLEAMPLFQPDIVLLDLGLPDMDGMTSAVQSAASHRLRLSS